MSQSDSSPKTMRDYVQKRFLEEIIGDASQKCNGWMVLILDNAATRVISSALTMFDLMEKRITLVEQLTKKRQPFREMDAVYLISPSVPAVEKIVEDFETAKSAKYNGVHIFFLDEISPTILSMLQKTPVLFNKLKTLKEINMDFIVSESEVFQLDEPYGLYKLHGSVRDTHFPEMLGRKLATLCFTVNEYPIIRYQNSSAFAREIAQSLQTTLEGFRKKCASTWWYNGDSEHNERDRGHVLILDRTFDPLSPIMHEYTYQAMVTDLLTVKDGAIKYALKDKNQSLEKEALLNETDALWVELRYHHIAKVIETIKSRMQDVIQTNTGALLKSKQTGSNVSITDMAAAVKELPEYRQTMAKLSQHVSIAQQCMDAFGRLGLMEQSQLEQTMSTGVDEDGKEVKGNKLVDLLRTAASNPSLDDAQKLRLLAIFIVSQRAATPEDKRSLFQAAKVSLEDQQIILNLDRLCLPVQSAQSAAGKPAASIFTSLFRGKAPVHAATAEGEYADTRHVGQLKGVLEQWLAGNLANDKYTALDSNNIVEKSNVGKSVRRPIQGAGARLNTNKKEQYTGSRYICFIAGGVSYSELRVSHDIMDAQNKEIITGSTHIVNPSQFLNDVGLLSKTLNLSELQLATTAGSNNDTQLGTATSSSSGNNSNNQRGPNQV